MDPQPPSPPDFPHGPPKLGNVYVMDMPDKVRVIVMLEQTWVDFGTRQTTMIQLLGEQDARIKELLAETAVARQMASDAMTRLENIRHARRQEIRSRVEPELKELLLPDDADFLAPRKN